MLAALVHTKAALGTVLLLRLSCCLLPLEDAGEIGEVVSGPPPEVLAVRARAVAPVGDGAAPVI